MTLLVALMNEMDSPTRQSTRYQTLPAPRTSRGGISAMFGLDILDESSHQFLTHLF